MHNIRLKSGALKTRFRVRDLQDKSGNKPADEACQLIQGFTVKPTLKRNPVKPLQGFF